MLLIACDLIHHPSHLPLTRLGYLSSCTWLTDSSGTVASRSHPQPHPKAETFQFYKGLGCTTGHLWHKHQQRGTHRLQAPMLHGHGLADLQESCSVFLTVADTVGKTFFFLQHLSTTYLKNSFLLEFPSADMFQKCVFGTIHRA